MTVGHVTEESVNILTQTCRYSVEGSTSKLDLVRTKLEKVVPQKQLLLGDYISVTAHSLRPVS